MATDSEQRVVSHDGRQWADRGGHRHGKGAVGFSADKEVSGGAPFRVFRVHGFERRARVNKERMHLRVGQGPQRPCLDRCAGAGQA
jgi:hypothetical protein